MSEPYTPSTDEVRSAYADNGGEYRDISEGWFDRWLNEVKAQAWEEGAMQGHDDHEFGVEVWTNPYRKGN